MGGALWLIGVPLLYAVINVFVFSILMSGKIGDRYGEAPFALFYFSGLAVWIVFADVTGRSTFILREYAYLINKIAFPVWLLPLLSFASALLTQLIVLSIVGGLMLWYGHASSSALIFFPLVWLSSILLSLGVAYGTSALSVFIPDLAQAIPVLLNILFFLSPILYSPLLVEQAAGYWSRQVLMNWNPIYYLVEASRASLIGTGEFPWAYLAYSFCFAAIALVLGIGLFARLRKGFADVL